MDATRDYNRETARALDLVSDELEACKQAAERGDIGSAKSLLDHLTSCSFPLLQELVLQAAMFFTQFGDVMGRHEKSTSELLAIYGKELRQSHWIIAGLLVGLAITWTIVIPYFVFHAR